MCACVSVAVLLVRTAPSRTRGGVFFFVLFFVVIVVVFPFFSCVVLLPVVCSCVHYMSSSMYVFT